MMFNSYDRAYLISRQKMKLTWAKIKNSNYTLNMQISIHIAHDWPNIKSMLGKEINAFVFIILLPPYKRTNIKWLENIGKLS